jgi:hypothetical protein
MIEIIEYPASEDKLLLREGGSGCAAIENFGVG